MSKKYKFYLVSIHKEHMTISRFKTKKDMETRISQLNACTVCNCEIVEEHPLMDLVGDSFDDESCIAVGFDSEEEEEEEKDKVDKVPLCFTQHFSCNRKGDIPEAVQSETDCDDCAFEKVCKKYSKRRVDAEDAHPELNRNTRHADYPDICFGTYYDEDETCDECPKIAACKGLMAYLEPQM